MGFTDGKPLAACIIYKFLLQTRAFEAEITTVFDVVIKGISDAIKVLEVFKFSSVVNSFIILTPSNFSAFYDLIVVQCSKKVGGFL